MHVLALCSEIDVQHRAMRVARELVEHLAANRPRAMRALCAAGFRLFGERLTEESFDAAVASFAAAGTIRFEELHEVPPYALRALSEEERAALGGEAVRLAVVRVSLRRGFVAVPRLLGVALDERSAEALEIFDPRGLARALGV